jgi:hypothetical protein
LTSNGDQTHTRSIKSHKHVTVNAFLHNDQTVGNMTKWTFVNITHSEKKKTINFKLRGESYSGIREIPSVLQNPKIHCRNRVCLQHNLS